MSAADILDGIDTKAVDEMYDSLARPVAPERLAPAVTHTVDPGAVLAALRRTGSGRLVPIMSDELRADYVAINVRLAKASDAWLSAQTAVEKAEQAFAEAKAEYLAAFQALTDANDARLLEAVERTDAG